MIEAILGVFTGMIFGMFPGLHVNSLLPWFFNQGPDFIISLSFSWVFFSLVPTIFLGVPSGENYINLHPIHKRVLSGEGVLVIKESAVSMLFSFFLILLFFPLILTIYSNYSLLKYVIPVVLFLVVISFIRDLQSFLVVIFSSVLGMISCGREVLFSLLTGFFGIPLLLFSIFQNNRIPEQRDLVLRKCSLYESFSTSFLSGIFSIFPGVSSNIVGAILKRINPKTDLITSTSSTNLSFMFYSFLTLFFLEKARSGSAVYLSLYPIDLTRVMICAMFSITSAFFILFTFARFWARISSLNRPGILAFLTLILFIMSFVQEGWFGFLVLLSASFIGLFCNLCRVPRISMMSALMIPAILFS